MGLSNAFQLWWVRLRARLVGECFALVGIAAGVALLFASQISSQSLQSSVGQLSRGIVGRASLQLLARDPHGFPESLLARARHIPGVRAAAPLLEVNANAIGPRGSESVALVGADESLQALGGELVRHLQLEPFGGVGAIVLPAPLSRKLGVHGFGSETTLQIAGRQTRAPLYETLSAKQIGGLAASPVAIAPLFYVQEMAGLEGRVSRILVALAPHRQAQVTAALLRLAGGRLNVESTSYDEKLFSKAATAANRSTSLFALISALVGFLFAFNAMLLTVPQRRRLIAELRRDGYSPGTVIAVLLLDAVALGALACLLGLALGDELSIHVLHSDPAFLSLAFAIGSQRVVTASSVMLAVAGGMLAAVIAVLSPLREILSRDPLAAITPRLSRVGFAGAGRLAVVGVGCLSAASAILLLAPNAAIPGMVLLLCALLLVLPFALGVTLGLARRAARMLISPVGHVAVMELSAARARAVAIAASGAVAVFGSVAIQGAHHDLLAGLENAAAGMNASTDVWVTAAGSYNLLDTTPFAPTQRRKLEQLPGVRSVSLYRGGLLDWGQRRVLVIAPPADAQPLLAPGQIVEGDPRTATARVRGGGWLVLSRALASEHHLRIGQSFTLPTPDPMKFRVAAICTNAGWVPGAIEMNAADYARSWGSDDTSAYGVRLDAGTSPVRASAEIQHALGAHSGLAVESSGERAAKQRSLSRQALASLAQIARLIPIVAVLAMAAAMGALIWQRRPRLAKLKLEGIPRTQLWHTILLESLMLLAAGSLSGAVFGLYGEQLADHALSSVVDFPVIYSVAAVSALESLALVALTALAILAVPGWLAASVSPALALAD